MLALLDTDGAGAAHAAAARMGSNDLRYRDDRVDRSIVFRSL
jgi:hypothetical protein